MAALTDVAGGVAGSDSDGRRGTRTRRWFALWTAYAAGVFAAGVARLLTQASGFDEVIGAIGFGAGVLMGTGLAIEWVRNGPRDR